MQVKASVSVVIPCYRCEKTISRAVESVAAQTHVPAEVILVDDFSEDQTLDLLYRLQSSYPAGWIKVIALPINGGPSSARNAGWDAATQPYVAFLDSDDSWLKDKIAVQHKWMKDHPEVAMSGHACAIRSRNDVALDDSPGVRASSGFGRVSIARLLLRNRFPTRSVMLKRDLRQRFMAGKRYSEDFLLWLQIAFEHGEGWVSDTVLANTYKADFGEGGLSAQLWKMELGELEVYRMLKEWSYISRLEYSILCIWSLVKYGRRVISVSLR